MNTLDVDILDTRITPPDAPEPPPEPAPMPPYSIRRAAALLFLVLGVQLGFVAALVGAQHGSPADSAPVAIVATDPAVGDVVAQANTLRIAEYADQQAAIEAVHDRAAFAALVSDGVGGTELRVAARDTDPAARALIQAYTEAARAAGIRAAVFDDYSPQPDNTRNLTVFYLVVGWVAGGFLAATGLAIALGSVPASERRTQARLLAFLAYSIVSGVAGAILAGQIGVGYSLALATFGAMITFGAAMTAAALQGWFGLFGAATAIGLFLLLDNPGGILPSFLHDAQDWALTAIGTDLVRGVITLGGGSGSVGQLVVLWVYCFGGAVAFLLAGHIRRR